MKKYLFGWTVVASGLIMPQASAQDCCPYQYNSCCDELAFDGFYVGGNLGVFTHEANRNDLDAFATSEGWTTKDTDVTLGIQVGYDWLCCNSVFGIVADWNWTNNDTTLRTIPSGTDTITTPGFIKSESDWFTTIRARAGLSVCDGLFYITWGAAVARFNTKWGNTFNGNFHHHYTKWGWTGGAGVEFLAWCNFSVGAEVLFLHFDDRRKTFTNSHGTFSFVESNNTWVGRLLLNYRFGDLCSLWCCN